MPLNILPPPTTIETYKAYQNTVYADYDKKTGFFYISADHVSPIFAKEFLDLIIGDEFTISGDVKLDEILNIQDLDLLRLIMFLMTHLI